MGGGGGGGRGGGRINGSFIGGLDFYIWGLSIHFQL